MIAAPALEASCKVCAKPIKGRRSTLQTTCVKCVLSVAYAKEKAVRQERRETKAKLEALKPRGKWMKEAQEAFNAFIRARDIAAPCICCGKWPQADDYLPGGVWDAGHFLGRGAYPELRFNEDNCHKQLKSCNAGSTKYAAKGRTVAQGYRLRLIDKIGLPAVEALEGPHPPAHWSIDDLRAIKATYRAKARELEKA